MALDRHIDFEATEGECNGELLLMFRVPIYRPIPNAMNRSRPELACLSEHRGA